MKKKNIWIGLAVLLAFQINPLFAESEEMKKFQERMKGLKERLTEFRTNVTQSIPPKDKDPAKDLEQAPDKLSEGLESRKDAQVIVLFHDSSEKAPASKAVLHDPGKKESNQTPGKTSALGNKKGLKLASAN